MNAMHEKFIDVRQRFSYQQYLSECRHDTTNIPLKNAEERPAVSTELFTALPEEMKRFSEKTEQKQSTLASLFIPHRQL